MGTRSLTHIHNGNRQGPVLVTLYRQFDGYPTGHGNDLKTVGDMQIINGIGQGVAAGTHANGMGCYAAQIVDHFKDDIGGIYLVEPGSTDHGEDYDYHLWMESNGNDSLGGIMGNIHIEVAEAGFEGYGYQRPRKVLYSGPLSLFDPEKAEAFDDEDEDQNGDDEAA